jgi:phage-related minor tail protein
MAIDRNEANRQMLTQAGDVQNKTKDAVTRIQRQTAETEALASKTLEELRKQGTQMVQNSYVDTYFAILYGIHSKY